MSKSRGWHVVAALVWAGLGTLPLVLRQIELPPIPIVFGRLVLTVIGLGAVVAMRSRSVGGEAPRLLSVHRARVLLTAGVLAAHWSSLFAAYDRAPNGTVILIVYLAPVGVALAAPLALGERLTHVTIAALAASLVGFVLVAAPSVSATTGVSGLVLALGASVTFVALFVLSKPLAQVYGGLRLAFLLAAVATVLLAPVAAAQPWGRPNASWLWLIVIGLVHTAIAQALYLASLARVPATNVAILGYLEPVVVLVVGWLFLSEALPLQAILGGALIVAAGIALIRTEPEAVDVPG